jgi:hypothetical protein
MHPVIDGSLDLHDDSYTLIAARLEARGTRRPQGFSRRSDRIAMISLLNENAAAEEARIQGKRARAEDAERDGHEHEKRLIHSSHHGEAGEKPKLYGYCHTAT